MQEGCAWKHTRAGNTLRGAGGGRGGLPSRVRYLAGLTLPLTLRYVYGLNSRGECGDRPEWSCQTEGRTMCCTPTRRHHHSEADIHLQTGRL